MDKIKFLSAHNQKNKTKALWSQIRGNVVLVIWNLREQNLLKKAKSLFVAFAGLRKMNQNRIQTMQMMLTP